jgi:hypothetical protein
VGLLVEGIEIHAKADKAKVTINVNYQKPHFVVLNNAVRD